MLTIILQFNYIAFSFLCLELCVTRTLGTDRQTSVHVNARQSGGVIKIKTITDYN